MGTKRHGIWCCLRLRWLFGLFPLLHGLPALLAADCLAPLCRNRGAVLFGSVRVFLSRARERAVVDEFEARWVAVDRCKLASAREELPRRTLGPAAPPPCRASSAFRQVPRHFPWGSE